MEEIIQRANVIAEALTWMGTPFMDHQRVKHVGVDCLGFILEVFRECGLLKDADVPEHAAQFALHRYDEIYIDNLKKVMDEIDSPVPGDLAVYHRCRVYAHTAIVISWPTSIIFASPTGGVTLAHPLTHPFLARDLRRFPPRFFSPWRKSVSEDIA